MHGNEALLCIFNMSEHSVVAELPEGSWEVLDGHGFQSEQNERNISLSAWGAWFARRT